MAVTAMRPCTLLTRTVVQIDDAETMLAYVAREARGRPRLLARPAHGVLKAVALDGRDITHSRLLLPDMAFDGGPTRGIWVAHLLSGRVERQVTRLPARYVSGDAWIMLPTDAAGVFRSGNAYLGVTHLYPRLLAQVAATSPDDCRGEAIRFTSNEPVTPAAARRWVRLACSMFQLLNEDDVQEQPLVLGNAARLLAGAALTVFPNTALLAPTTADRWDSNEATLRRAVAYMDQHLADDISLADIAAAAHVSVRAVQLAFRRRLDTTPTAHLRRMRLERAHEDLLDSDPHRGTIGAVADRWGFAPSRFAAHYRQVYGRHPREVLHSARRHRPRTGAGEP